jgi:hypothetical protein
MNFWSKVLSLQISGGSEEGQETRSERGQSETDLPR